VELLEREPQRKQINDALKGVIHGQGAIVLLGREAGIGKTAFVTGAADSFRSIGRVLWRAFDPLS
jgi:predicted ATPase